MGAHQASLSFTVSWSLLRLMSVESVMPSNHLIPFAPCSSFPQSFPASGSFPVSQLFAPGGQSIGASGSVLLMTIQGWYPLALTGLISQFGLLILNFRFNLHFQQYVSLPRWDLNIWNLYQHKVIKGDKGIMCFYFAFCFLVRTNFFF